MKNQRFDRARAVRLIARHLQLYPGCDFASAASCCCRKYPDTFSPYWNWLVDKAALATMAKFKRDVCKAGA